MASKLAAATGRRGHAAVLLTGILSAVLLVSVAGPLASAPVKARSADAFVNSVGVNTHIPYDDTVYWTKYPLVKNKLDALGVRHIRDGARVSTYEPYNTTVYQRYRDLAKLGVKANLIVDPTKQRLDTVESADIRYIAEKSGPALAAFEGPNERDISGDPDWAAKTRAYQADLYRTVKALPETKSVPVLAPSLAHARNAATLGSLGHVLDRGNMHPYAGGLSPAYRYPDGYSPLDHYNILNTRKVSGEEPLVASEAGYHNALADVSSGQPGVSERAAARYVPRMFLEHFSRGIGRTYAYEFIDPKPDPQRADREKNFGLLRNDGSEKPAYRAMRNLIGLLEDPGPVFQPRSLDYALGGETAGVRRMLLQKRDGRFYLVLWQGVPSYDRDAKRDVFVPDRRVTLTLGRTAARAAAYRPTVSSAPVARYTAPKRLALKVPDHPLVVEITPKR